MKLFIWDSDFLPDWTSGMCVAHAESVERAREIIRVEAVNDCNKDWPQEIIESHVERVMDGVSGEPDYVIEGEGAHWISGGS